MKKGEKYAEKEIEKAKKFAKKEGGIARDEAVSVSSPSRWLARLRSN